MSKRKSKTISAEKRLKKQLQIPITKYKSPINPLTSMGMDEAVRRDLFLTLHDIGYINVGKNGVITRRGIPLDTVLGYTNKTVFLVKKKRYIQFTLCKKAVEFYPELQHTDYKPYIDMYVTYSIGRLVWLVYKDDMLDPRKSVFHKDGDNTHHALTNLTITL